MKDKNKEGGNNQHDYDAKQKIREEKRKYTEQDGDNTIMAALRSNRRRRRSRSQIIH
jgi:hypothetical protein